MPDTLGSPSEASPAPAVVDLRDQPAPSELPTLSNVIDRASWLYVHMLELRALPGLGPEVTYVAQVVCGRATVPGLRLTTALPYVDCAECIQDGHEAYRIDPVRHLH